MKNTIKILLGLGGFIYFGLVVYALAFSIPVADGKVDVIDIIAVCCLSGVIIFVVLYVLWGVWDAIKLIFKL